MKKAILNAALSISGMTSLMATDKVKQHDPVAHAKQIAYGHLPARALHIACYYKFFDELQDEPKSAQQIADSLNLRADSVKRLLRTLANHGIVTMNENECFELNENSRVLLGGSPESLQPAFAKEFDLYRWQAIGNLHLTLDEDQPSFNQLFRDSFYSYLEKTPEAARLFNAGMQNFSATEDQEVSRSYDFKRFSLYCDVGGGAGGLIGQVLRLNPHLKGLLFDLPEAIALSPMTNVEKIGSDFFTSIPPAQVYTIKRVLHNWKDNECVQILENTQKTLLDPKEGRILVIEKVLPRELDGNMLIDADLIGLALGGRERTLGEFIVLGKEANLALEDKIDLPSGISVMIFKTEKLYP